MTAYGSSVALADDSHSSCVVDAAAAAGDVVAVGAAAVGGDGDGEQEKRVENNLTVKHDGEWCLLLGNKEHYYCCPCCSKLDTDCWAQHEWANLKRMSEHEFSCLMGFHMMQPQKVLQPSQLVMRLLLLLLLQRRRPKQLMVMLLL